MAYSIKELFGIALKDTARYLPALYGTSNRRTKNGDPLWVHLKNRKEQLVANPDGPGVKCDWKWSSQLHAPQMIKSWGKKLFQRAFEDWTVVFRDLPDVAQSPEISIIFAHAGTERVPQLCSVIRSLGGQRDVAVECLVIDLSTEPIGGLLPAGVRYEHVETSHLQPGWYKSWAYNIGARLARGKLLLFHDGDICMPAGYCYAVRKALTQEGYEAASLQRFLFYLDEIASKKIQQAEQVHRFAPETILQNWKGGTIAIQKEKFFEIGGYDEGFVDWGGEDTEFFDRCGMLRQMEFGNIPFLHLWHKPQSGRRETTNLNTETVLPWRLSLSREQRCNELSRRDFGQRASPTPVLSYKKQVEQHGQEFFSSNALEEHVH